MIPVKTFVQGLDDRSAEQQQLAKAKAAKAERTLAKVNMAITHAEQYQLCGKKSHLALQCTGMSRSMHGSIRAALAVLATAKRAEPKCDHCGQLGYTAARCWQLHECHNCMWQGWPLEGPMPGEAGCSEEATSGVLVQQVQGQW